MALALALEAKSELEHGDVILLISLLYSLISILGVGAILGPVFKLLKVQKQKTDVVEKSTYESVFQEEEQASSGDSQQAPQAFNWCKDTKKSFLRFDLEVIAPLFCTEKALQKLRD